MRHPIQKGRIDEWVASLTDAHRRQLLMSMLRHDPQDGFKMNDDERDAESAVRARRVTTQPAWATEGGEKEAY